MRCPHNELNLKAHRIRFGYSRLDLSHCLIISRAAGCSAIAPVVHSYTWKVSPASLKHGIIHSLPLLTSKSTSTTPMHAKCRITTAH